MQDDSVWFQHGRIQDGCHHKVESEWICEVFFVQMVGTNLGKCEWVWEGKLRWLNANWQNSRWLPSSSWVRMIEVESDWLVWVIVRVERECFWVNLREENKVSESKMAEFKMAAIIKFSQNERVAESDGTSLSQSFVQNGLIQDGRIQDGCHHQVNQIELVWVRFRVKGECFWVNLREDNKVFESKMEVSESKMAEFKMAAIISWIRMNEWGFLCAKWLNPWWQSSRWLPSSSWVRMNEFESDWISLSQNFVQNGWIQDGRIQDGCHNQVDPEWMSLSQMELVWVRVMCKMAESKMAEFKLVAIIKLIRLN